MKRLFYYILPFRSKEKIKVKMYVLHESKRYFIIVMLTFCWKEIKQGNIKICEIAFNLTLVVFYIQIC